MHWNQILGGEKKLRSEGTTAYNAPLCLCPYRLCYDVHIWWPLLGTIFAYINREKCHCYK